MRGRGALAALVLAAAPAGAEGALTADAFEALVEGRTLAWAAKGFEPYGIERYYADRRVTWFRLDERTCQEGTWHAAGTPEEPSICFAYEDDPKRHCFRVAMDGGTMVATDLSNAGLILSDLGKEHGVPFGCGYLGS